MKIRTLTGLSLAGMLLTSATVYSLAGPRVATADAPSAAGSTTEVVTLPPVALDDAHFQAAGTVALEAAVGNAQLPSGASGETYLLLEVKGASGAKAVTRAPVSLAVVVDRSGSMRGSRLSNAIQAARSAVDRLRDGDVVSVVAFDQASRVIVPPTTLDGSARASVGSALNGITLGGDTCISCGMEDALSLLARTTGSVNRMIVLSDGDATAGVRDVPGFRAIAQRAAGRGVSITTVGVNVDYNEKILGAIAQESNGQHYFVQDDAALSRAFQDETEAVTKTVGANVEVAFDLAPNVELDRVFDRSFTKSDRRVVVPLGAVAADETKSVLVKVRVKGVAAVTKLAHVTLSYKDLVGDRAATSEGDLSVHGGEQASPMDPDVASRVQRSETASAIEESNRLLKEHKLDEAQRRLADESSRVRKASDALAKGPRSADAEKDLKAQTAALDRATDRMKPKQQLDPTNPFEGSFDGKSAVRGNGKDAFDLRR